MSDVIIVVMSEDSIDIDKVLELCPIGGGVVRDELCELLDGLAIGSLRRFSGMVGGGLGASELSGEFRELGVLTLVRGLLSGNDGVALRAAEKLLDRSDGRAVNRVEVGSGLSVGGRVISGGDELVRVLEFLDRSSGGDLGRRLGVIDVDASEVSDASDASGCV